MHHDHWGKGQPFTQKWGKHALQNFNMPKDGSIFINQKMWNSVAQGKTWDAAKLSQKGKLKRNPRFKKRQVARPGRQNRSVSNLEQKAKITNAAKVNPNFDSNSNHFNCNFESVPSRFCAEFPKLSNEQAQQVEERREPSNLNGCSLGKECIFSTALRVCNHS